MAINLAEDAVHALNRAAAAAAREGSEAVSPTHILAGALSHQDPVLTRALAALDLELEAVPETLRNAPVVYGGHLPFTPPAHEVLAAAIEHAAAGGGPGAPTACAHLLVGVARAGDAETQAVLAEWGLDPEALADAVDEELCPTETADVPGALQRG